jgi:galactonate dehydratase
MKITDVKTYLTAPHGSPFLFVEVLTDEGVTGVGEATLPQANYLLVQGFEAVRPLVVGLDPANIEEVWQRLFRRFLRIGPRGVVTCILSAIDIALWDIKGKVLGAPVYQLLGGPVRDSVPLYTHVQDATSGISLDDVKEQARRARADGYHALKTDPFAWARSRSGPFQGASLLEWLTPGMIADSVEWIEAIREAVGSDYELMVDAHARFDVATAIRAARALESQDLFWFEEPVPPESYAALKQFREATTIPVSVGETLFSRYDFSPVFEDRLADYVMPDVAWTGGISELRRIAAMAETYYIPFSPHDAIGPVALMAAFHVCMATPNLYRQECIHTRFDDFSTYVTPMFEHHDGALWPSDLPGLGIELVHDVIAEHALDPDDPRASPYMGDQPSHSPLGPE